MLFRTLFKPWPENKNKNKTKAKAKNNKVKKNYICQELGNNSPFVARILLRSVGGSDGT